jgi:hypothetical protein
MSDSLPWIYNGDSAIESVSILTPMRMLRSRSMFYRRRSVLTVS